MVCLKFHDFKLSEHINNKRLDKGKPAVNFHEVVEKLQEVLVGINCGNTDTKDALIIIIMATPIPRTPWILREFCSKTTMVWL